jgi:hypothetical protein
MIERAPSFTARLGRSAAPLLPLLLLLGALAPACGRSPVAGVEGELCGSDNDCSSGLVCDRRVCIALDRLDASADATTHAGVLFAVLLLEQWDGPSGAQIAELGRFVSDLSTVLAPYYAFWASSDTEARFGRVDTSTDPLDFAAGSTVTTLTLDRQEALYTATADVLYLPLVYSDASVSLNFDMPLHGGHMAIAVGAGDGHGSTGSLQLDGALRESDAHNLMITRDGQTFSLYDVLRDEPLTVDTDSDGVPDAWSLSWVGTAEIE